MAFCNKCGTEIRFGSKVCPSCGERIGSEVVADTVTDRFNQFNDTVDTTAEFDRNDIECNKAMAFFAYIGIFVLIPWFGARDSRFARFHANQGLVLAITEIAWFIIQNVITIILFSVSWKLAFVSIILDLVYIVFFVLAIIGIINAFSGRAKELPLIGGIKILK